MSADYEDKARTLAARIAQRLATTDAPAATSDDIADLRAGLGEVLQRLSVIESRLAPQKSQMPDAKLQTPKIHPSQERFNLEPAVAEMVDFLEDVKRCGFEPGNKPCDNCGICTSRGF